MTTTQVSQGAALSSFEIAAMDVICRSGACRLHTLVADFREDMDFEEVCMLIRDTVGCPLFGQSTRKSRVASHAVANANATLY